MGHQRAGIDLPANRALSCSLVDRPLVPADLVGIGAMIVPDGARLDGSTGAAVCSLSACEHKRRQSMGLGAVVDGADLETLSNLPVNEPVTQSDLTSWEFKNLGSAPRGALESANGTVIRRLNKVLEVHAVIVSGRNLGPLLKRLAPFRRVSQCIVVLPANHRSMDDQLWEADAAGIGVWVGDQEPVELVQPDAFPSKILTAGRWLFEELVYDRWLKSMHPTESYFVTRGRPVRTDFEEPDRSQYFESLC